MKTAFNFDTLRELPSRLIRAIIEEEYILNGFGGLGGSYYIDVDTACNYFLKQRDGGKANEKNVSNLLYALACKEQYLVSRLTHFFEGEGYVCFPEHTYFVKDMGEEGNENYGKAKCDLLIRKSSDIKETGWLWIECKVVHRWNPEKLHGIVKDILRVQNSLRHFRPEDFGMVFILSHSKSKGEVLGFPPAFVEKVSENNYELFMDKLEKSIEYVLTDKFGKKDKHLGKVIQDIKMNANEFQPTEIEEKGNTQMKRYLKGMLICILWNAEGFHTIMNSDKSILKSTYAEYKT